MTSRFIKKVKLYKSGYIASAILFAISVASLYTAAQSVESLHKFQDDWNFVENEYVRGEEATILITLNAAEMQKIVWEQTSITDEKCQRIAEISHNITDGLNKSLTLSSVEQALRIDLIRMRSYWHKIARSSLRYCSADNGFISPVSLQSHLYDTQLALKEFSTWLHRTLARSARGINAKTEMTLSNISLIRFMVGCVGIFAVFMFWISRRILIERNNHTSTQHKLSVYEQRFRELIENSNQGLAVINSSMRCLYVNTSFLHMIDQAPEHPLPVDFISLLTSKCRQDVSTALLAIFNETYDKHTVRAELIRQDMTTLWVDLMIGRVDWQGENAAEITVIDVTEQVYIDYERQFQHEELENRASQLAFLAEEMEMAKQRETEQKRFQTALLDSMPSPVVYIDQNKIIQQCNSAFLKFFNLLRGESLGKSINSITGMNEIIDWDESKTTEVEIPFPHISKHMLLKSTTFYDEQQNPAGHIAVFIDLTERKELENRLRTLATTDPLTGALNRRAFMDISTQKQQDCIKTSKPFVMMLMDIDHFKSINDTYGHSAGDECLKDFVMIVKNILNTRGILGRIGGEEFAICLANCDFAEAKNIAEKIRTTTENFVVKYDAHKIKFTTSIGVTAMQKTDEMVDELMKTADTCLYDAKNSGRNKVVYAQQAQII
jgi:diguanylate cyclase (GGDEF)-like protein/PAS domain S-box-containing protein